MSRHDILLRSQFERIIEGDRVGQAGDAANLLI